jgi:hypothetical protein
VRAEFARRAAALGRLVARTEGAAAWWSRRATKDPARRSFVAVALTGRPELVTELLDAMRPEYPAAMGDLLLWLRRCADELRCGWWPLPTPAEPPREILSLGGRIYRIGGREEVVTEVEDNVLRTFLREGGTLTEPQLAEKSGVPHAGRVLRDLVKKYPGARAAITLSGRSKRGHRVRIAAKPTIPQ